MKERFYRRGNKYRRRKSLEPEDWVTVLVLIATFIFAGIHTLLGS